MFLLYLCTFVLMEGKFHEIGGVVISEEERRHHGLNPRDFLSDEELVFGGELKRVLSSVGVSLSGGEKNVQAASVSIYTDDTNHKKHPHFRDSEIA